MATIRQPLSFDGVRNFLDTLFDDDMHAKRVLSLANATLGRPDRIPGGHPSDRAWRWRVAW